MNRLIRHVKKLIEESEPGMTVAQVNGDELFACPVGVALWQEFRRLNPDAPKVPPEDLMNFTDPEMAAYVAHAESCDDCNEV